MLEIHHLFRRSHPELKLGGGYHVVRKRVMLVAVDLELRVDRMEFLLGLANLVLEGIDVIEAATYGVDIPDVRLPNDGLHRLLALVVIQFLEYLDDVPDPE
ncbi:hypothetical protein LINGRAHAP2_LOCUS21018 [Linum grandiflorum]